MFLNAIVQLENFLNFFWASSLEFIKTLQNVASYNDNAYHNSTLKSNGHQTHLSSS